MNGFPESQTAEQFDTDDYQVLVVAEKYQTGFDQPLLYAMYVDKTAQRARTRCRRSPGSTGSTPASARTTVRPRLPQRRR